MNKFRTCNERKYHCNKEHSGSTCSTYLPLYSAVVLVGALVVGVAVTVGVAGIVVAGAAVVTVQWKTHRPSTLPKHCNYSVL